MPEGTILNIIAAVHEISNWLIRVIMLLVITRRHRPQSALVWLLVVFITPWVGLLLYALLGTNRLPRKRVKQHRRFMDSLDAAAARLTGNSDIARPTLDPAFRSTERLAQRLGHMAVVGGNKAEIICANEELLERMIHDIDAAKHHVHVLYYIYEDDPYGRRFAQALIRAKKRGVACRLLVDAVGSWGMLKHMAPELAKAGIEVYEALPVGLFRKGMARWDLRNHRKLVVVDGCVAYTGSHNMIDAGYGTETLQWHDLSLRLSGPLVLQLQTVFMADWYFETDDLLDDPAFFPKENVRGDLAAQTIPSGPNYPTENYQRLILSALHSAQEQVTITTPYFVPDDSLMIALESAALRDVEVNLIVPKKSDQIVVGAAAQAHYEELMNWGINLYLYEPAIIHAKIMTIDGAVAFVGTSNFDIRSFSLNFEINLAFYSPSFAKELRERQKRYIEASTRLEPDVWDNRSTARRIYQNLAKLFSPLL
ncbi:MAG: cardiolipin synthase [Candidatus Hydrogenedentota bacterium]